MQIFAIHEVSICQFFKKNRNMPTSLVFHAILFAVSTLLLSFTTNIFAADSQRLTRTKSRQANELLIHVGHHNLDGHYSGLYLIIHDGSELSTDRLLELERLRGLKIEILGSMDERIPGVYWVGGIGQAPQLKGFSASLRILDLGLSTTSQTFKLSNAGSPFLKALVNLEELNLSNHFITDGASNLAGLVKLRRLDLYNNKVGASIEYLKTLVNMEVLNLGNNGNMPIEPLKETLLAMTKLEEVDLSFLSGVSEDMFNGWFAPQIAAGIRVRPPRLEIVSGICPVFEDHAYSLICDGIINASDFLREMNCRLRYEDCPPSRALSKAECVVPGCLINVLSHKGDGQAWYQMVYDPEHFLMKGEAFTPSDHNHLLEGAARKGTRKVAFYSQDGKRVLCIKEAPEAPGMERAARILHETLFGVEDMGVPNSETILMNGKVFTVSSYVDGKSLDEVIGEIEAQEAAKKADVHPNKSLEFIVNLHQMKVFAILTGPEDGRPQNCICLEVKGADGGTNYRLVSIDHDRCFGDATPHPSLRDPDVTVRGHSVMHCFSESHPNYDDLKRVLFSKTPKAIFEEWLNQIRIEDRYQHTIAPFAKMTGNTRLGVPITKTVARNLFENLNVIYDGLRAEKTLEDIFMVAEPTLALVYKSSQVTPVSPPGVILRVGDTIPPRSSLARAAKRVRRVDGGRLAQKRHLVPVATYMAIICH
ncbi:MAG: leucine-rich repeat domain-containing protein [Alphaproteobacteria bacterium]